MQPPHLGIVLETLIKLSIGSKRIFIANEGVVNSGGTSELLLCARLFSEVEDAVWSKTGSRASRRV